MIQANVRSTQTMVTQRATEIRFKELTLFTDNLGVIASLAAFLLFLGVVMKEIKTRYAATLQLYIGLWWNSVTRTLELEDSKLQRYLEAIDAAASASVLSLRDVQSLAGKLQRCALTFPPGSECVFASLYAFAVTYSECRAL